MQAERQTDTNKLIELVVLPSTTVAVKGIVNYVQVLFKIITGRLNTDVQRAPLHLAIVLDRSGSMQSKQKLENAKKAINQVIQNLTADDILHLILYDSDVDVCFQNGSLTNKDSLIAKVNAVKTRGSTNLVAGLQKGEEVIKEHKKAGYTQRIFLFSDGLVNEGVTNKDEIHKIVSDIYSREDIKISAFGLGDDFDEELMKSIAEYGCGAYFFIEGSAAIPKFVASALTGLLELVASDTLLQIRGMNGGVVNKIYGHKDLVKGAMLDDLRADNVRSVVCELEVRPSASSQEEEVVTYHLTYRPAGKEAAIENKTEGIEGSIKLRYVTDPAEVEKNQNAEVKVAVVIQQTGEIDQELVSLIDAGKHSEAVTLQEKQISLFKSVAELDEGGKQQVSGFLCQAERDCKELKEKGITKESRKQAHHRGYMKRRNSLTYNTGYI